jgi:hypothetical protein
MIEGALEDSSISAGGAQRAHLGNRCVQVFTSPVFLELRR